MVPLCLLQLHSLCSLSSAVHMNSVSGNGEKSSGPTPFLSYSRFSGMLQGDIVPDPLPPRTFRRLSERKIPAQCIPFTAFPCVTNVLSLYTRKYNGNIYENFMVFLFLFSLFNKSHKNTNHKGCLADPTVCSECT